MTVRMNGIRVAAILTAAGLALSACGSDEEPTNVGSAVNSATSSAGGAASDATAPAGKLSGIVNIDGSSTVAPLAQAAADFFKDENGGVNVNVGTSGTGGGFEKFCAGETDISTASRPIKDEEKALCEKQKITFDEFTVANDALTVVVSKDNDWATCLTTDQLKKIWDEGSKVASWKDVDAKFPDEKLSLFGPGTDSGTFDYFTDEINGEEGKSRTDYQPSEDDNVIVTGVSGSKGAMGYLGYTYYEENADKLKAIEIDSGDGCVAPSLETVQDGTYKPLARELYIYVNGESLSKPQVAGFVEYFATNIDKVVEDALFIGLTGEQKTTLTTKLEELKSKA